MKVEKDYSSWLFDFTTRLFDFHSPLLYSTSSNRVKKKMLSIKISYKVGNWNASPALPRETAMTGPSFLAAATTSG